MDTSSANTSRRGDTAQLSCTRCKRRKIKCDRILPTCQTCLKSSENCLYPLVSHKPGPKPGVPQRRRNRTTPAVQQRAVETNEISYRAEDEHGAPITTSTDQSAGDLDRSVSRGLALSQLIHPSHEPLVQNAAQVLMDLESSAAMDAPHACESFGLSANAYQNLVDAYFDNITAFSLFHRPSFDEKISRISNPLHAQALLASLFSVSARYTEDARSNVSPQNKWLLQAQRLVDESMRECSDDVPPLCLLQAMILTTFQELINGVRGRAWRSVGACVRIAYELQLHLIDKNPHRGQEIGTLEEEKRRAWWAIWEFDVFACTIRRLPPAIDWVQNETWLPIDDELWFANAPVKSCPLDPDPVTAWKKLQAAGNRSPKAWFIVVNALMRCAHVLSYPQSYANDGAAEIVRSRLEVLANSLFCLTAALPCEAAYGGEFLTFSTCPQNRASFQLDGAKHSIHIMIQLSRFMINHYQVFDSTSRRLALGNETSATSQQAAIDDAAWTHYLGAASEIVKLVRGCAPKHVNYVNPFLASTIWLAAAAQVVSRAFSTSSADRRVAASNLDVLQMNLNAFVEIWGVSKNLQQKLVSLEARLTAFKDQMGNEQQRQLSRLEIHSPRLPRTLNQGQMTPDSIASAQPQQGHISTSSIPAGHSSVTWTIPPDLDWTNSSMGAELGSNLWGWGVDELLQYGVS